MTEIEVRLVRPHEWWELRRVRLSALGYSPHLADQLANETAAPPSFWRDRAERAASATTTATVVAVDAGAFVGVVDGFVTPAGTVEIGGMWVNPRRRRTGIGRDLLSAVLAWGRERGAARAGLWVGESNEAARALYESAGFDVGKTSGAGMRLEKML